MPTASANGIDIAYETFGNPDAPAILLIMGLGAQLTLWRESFCRRLADAGFHVIRYDNRDVGRSSKFAAAGVPNMALAMQQAMRGEPVDAPYTLTDMAADAIGLVDTLQIEKAHIVGASMGGMIAQIVAAQYPERSSSLVSIMSTSGRPGLPPATPEAMSALMSRPSATDRDSLIDHVVKTRRIIGSPGYREDDATVRREAAIGIDRSYYPDGAARQFAAVLKSGSRADLLKTIRVPSLVIHGIDDPLVPVAAGKDTAALIPGCAILLVPGMGHGLESGLEPVLTDAIVGHCRKAAA